MTPKIGIDFCQHKLFCLCTDVNDDDDESSDHVVDDLVISNGEDFLDEDEESVGCLLPRYIQKIKCCDCGLGIERKPIMCGGCRRHEECSDCHCLRREEDLVFRRFENGLGKKFLIIWYGY